MASADTPKHDLTDSNDSHTVNGHDLIAVSEWLPGTPPTKADSEVFDAHEYETRYFRCRKCGQERNRAAEFLKACSVERLPNPVTDGGYTVEDGRTRRALTEEMIVHYDEFGPRYRVDSESGRFYLVDVEADTCTCPDHRNREVRCKHVRRVDLEIRAGLLPGPDGRFVR